MGPKSSKKSFPSEQKKSFPSEQKKSFSSLLLPNSEESEKLPYRFRDALDNPLIKALDLDSWAGVIHFLAEGQQTQLQRVSKGFYNLYWDTRREYSFDPNSSQGVFSAITEDTLAFLLSKCNPEYFSGLSLRYCFNTRAGTLLNVFNIRSLRKLDLTYCYKVQSSHLEHISKLDCLDQLNLTGCELLGKQGLEYVSLIPNLTQLRLAQLPQIMTLGAIAENMKKLRHLTIIQLESVIGINVVQKLLNKQCVNQGLMAFVNADSLEDNVLSIPVPTGVYHELNENNLEYVRNQVFNNERDMSTTHNFGNLTSLTHLFLCPNSSVFKWPLLSFNQLQRLNSLTLGNDCIKYAPPSDGHRFNACFELKCLPSISSVSLVKNDDFDAVVLEIIPKADF